MDPRAILQRSQKGDGSRAREAIIRAGRGSRRAVDLVSPPHLPRYLLVAFPAGRSDQCSLRSLNTNGQDRLGSPILFQQIYLARDLEKWRARLAKEPDIPPGLLDNVDRSLDRLMWTLFSLSSVTTINLENGQIQKPPSRRKPTLIHDGIGDHQTWVAYPQRQSPTTFHPECHYHSFISLMEKISRDDPLFPPEGWVKDLSETTEMFRRLYAELEEWPQTLPECMRLHENAMPHVVALQ